jgi:NAD(P)-dependent dehydrogenase (short-subunit alcohol dehydrogenase family)
MALELAPNKIRVNCILPGLTETDMNRNQWQNNPELWEKRASPIPLGRPGRADDYVGAALFLASDDSSWMTGAEITIDGGVSCK